MEAIPYAGAADRFPVGMRVLVVDDDPLCLMILKKMLQQCKYDVTTCNRAIEALQLLRERTTKFDLVMSDVYMPDIDGFKLLELIGLEMDLPVIMMSANGETSVVMKGITHGACDYLLKPVRLEELRNIWQHVVRKRVTKEVKEESSGEWEDSGERTPDSASEQSSRKRKEKFDVGEEQIDSLSGLKKPRVVWSGELHRLFVNAVNQLGVEKAVPKKILDIMNVQGLSRENVASHLQKYRQERLFAGVSYRDEAAWATMVLMYGQRRGVTAAQRTFDAVPPRDRGVVAWTALVTAYAGAGSGAEAVALFRAMELDGIHPDAVAFLSLLAAFSHAGRLEDGLRCLVSMRPDYGVAPLRDHYCVVVDLLARAGRTAAAAELAAAISYGAAGSSASVTVAWKSLLSACRVHREVATAATAATATIGSDGCCSSSYALVWGMLGA